MTWKIVIDPGHGRMGVGSYDSGVQCGFLCEADLAVALARSIEEELQRAAVRHSVLWEVLNGDGIPLAHRAENVPDRGTLISLHYHMLRRPGFNASQIYVGRGPVAMALAKRLADVVATWGQATCRRYSGCEVLEDHCHSWIFRPEITSIIISPFSITAPDALIYSRRIEQLGRAIAANVATWALGQNPAARCYAPVTAQRDFVKGPTAKPMGALFRGRSEEPQRNDTARRVSVLVQDEPNE